MVLTLHSIEKRASVRHLSGICPDRCSIEQLTFKMNNFPPRRILRAVLNFIEFSSSPKLTKISSIHLLIHFTKKENIINNNIYILKYDI